MALTPEQLAHLTKLSHLQSLASRTAAVAEDLQSQIDALDTGAIKSVKVNGTALTATEGAVDVLIAVEKKQTPNTGYAASYTVKANGTALSPDIDIPKDWLLSDVDKGTVTSADKAAGGKFENDEDFAIGDRYVDMTFNVKAGGAETATHIYLNVQEFIDIYEAGDGLQESSGTFSIKIDSSNARGLSTSSNGLALALATPDTYSGSTKTADGTAGAMSSADKYKLDGVSNGANKVTVTTAGSGALEIDGTSHTIVNIATDAEVSEMIDAALPAPSANSGE